MSSIQKQLLVADKQGFFSIYGLLLFMLVISHFMFVKVVIGNYLYLYSYKNKGYEQAELYVIRYVSVYLQEQKERYVNKEETDEFKLTNTSYQNINFEIHKGDTQIDVYYQIDHKLVHMYFIYEQNTYELLDMSYLDS